MTVEGRRAARVVDLSRSGGGPRLEVAAAEAAEVLMSISCLCADESDVDTYELGGDRIRALRASLAPDLLGGIAAVAGTHGKLLSRLLGIVEGLPPPRSFASFLTRLAELDALELQLTVLGYYVRGLHAALPSEEVLAAARGEPGARARLLQVTGEWPDARSAAETVLELGAVRLKERLLELLPRWQEDVVAPLAAEALPPLARDAAAKRELLRGRSIEESVELVTNGVQYTPGPEVRRVALFPSYWLRPWVLFTDHEEARIFCYPAGEQAVPVEAPAADQLARIFKALGDEGRLRLLKRLSEGPLALGEAADLLGLTKPTAHHHLAILRQAGFVFVRDEVENVYTLRSDLLPQAGALLDAYLRR